MNRWFYVLGCAILGMVLVVCGLLVPVHLRAVDVAILKRAGRNSPTVVDQGLNLAQERKEGAAQMLLAAAQSKNLPGNEKLAQAVAALRRPGSQVWGEPELQLEPLFPTDTTPTDSVPFVEFIVPEDNRATALEYLSASKSPTVQQLMQFRSSTNTVIFPSSQSAAGSALDTAISVCGLLIDQGHLTSQLNNAVLARASDANHGGESEPIEETLMDFMSLGQRFNWGQLVAFVGPIEDAGTLHQLADAARGTETQMPVLFAAVQLSGQPAMVADYLNSHPPGGLNDLAFVLPYGTGALDQLVHRNLALYSSPYTASLTAIPPFGAIYDFSLYYAWRTPQLALAGKWFLYLLGGFFIAMAMHFARPAVPAIERPLQVRGFHVAREILFALGFLLVVLLLSEPFLSQDSQKAEFAFHLRLPTVGSAIPAGASGAHATIMNKMALLTLLLFFVLQALIYIACLVKLAEIGRQNVVSRIKLRLLENEEHLFDAGLYLGFAGTIISLILVSLNVIQPSLMAAYSSTSFGIVFVSIFKIFNLRPAKRKLLLESEAIPPANTAPAAVPAYATTS
jgi:hypothetical protein